LIITILALTLSIGVVQAESGDAIFIQPSSSSVETGQSVTVEIIGVAPENFSDVRSIQFDVLYDDTKLRLDSVTEGSLLNNNSQDPTYFGYTLLPAVINDLYISRNDTHGIHTNSGVFVTLAFTTTSSGDAFIKLNKLIWINSTTTNETATVVDNISITNATVTVTPQTNPPGGGDTGSGGGGGGGSGGGTIPPEEEELIPIEVQPTEINLSLLIGEESTQTIEILNDRDEDVNVTVSVEGSIFELVSIPETFFQIGAGSTYALDVNVFSLESTQPGLYIGNIVITADGEHKVSVTIMLEKPKEPLFDVFVEVFSSTISVGEDLPIQIRLVNMGDTERIDDAVIMYKIKQLNSGDIIVSGKENASVGQEMIFSRNITLPNDMEQGRYTIELNVSYDSGTKYAYATGTFDVKYVTSPDVYTPLAILIIMLIIIPVAYLLHRRRHHLGRHVLYM